MKELAKQFIGEECIIYTITSNDGGASIVNVHESNKTEFDIWFPPFPTSQSGYCFRFRQQ